MLHVTMEASVSCQIPRRTMSVSAPRTTLDMTAEHVSHNTLMDRMHVRKKWRPQGIRVIMFSFLMDFTFDLYVFHFFGVELGNWFEVVLGPGVMDRPGSKAVGIGAEADVKNSELFASAERWRPTLEACRAGLLVATITQGTCSSIHIAAALSPVFALLLLKPRHSIQGWTPLALSNGRKNVLHGYRKRLSDIHSFAALLRICHNEQHTLLGPYGCHFFQVESTGDDLSLTSIANKVTGLPGWT